MPLVKWAKRQAGNTLVDKVRGVFYSCISLTFLLSEAS